MHIFYIIEYNNKAGSRTLLEEFRTFLLKKYKQSYFLPNHEYNCDKSSHIDTNIIINQVTRSGATTGGQITGQGTLRNILGQHFMNQKQLMQFQCKEYEYKSMNMPWIGFCFVTLQIRLDWIRLDQKLLYLTTLLQIPVIYTTFRGSGFDLEPTRMLST